jgi:predicted metal-dependent HD superfamily phosphohydrolase
MPLHTKLIEKTRSYITALFEQEDKVELTFHNFAHTQEVVARVEQLAQVAGLPQKDIEILVLAAWFHDIGYLYGYSKHEAKSILLAQAFFNTQNVPTAMLEKIIACIEATEVGIAPKSRLQALLKDADLAYGCTEYFFERGPLLRQEWSYCLSKDYSNQQWENIQYHFICNVKFWSPEAKDLYASIRTINEIRQLKEIEKRIQH